jgi:hypothetical protein
MSLPLAVLASSARAMPSVPTRTAGRRRRPEVSAGAAVPLSLEGVSQEMSTEADAAEARGGAAEQERRRTEALQRQARRERALYWIVLFCIVAAPVAAAVLLDAHSQIFVLKAAAIVLLAGLPGWLYLEFIKFKGYSLYDEYVINLFRLRIDRYCNLPAPPKHTSWYQLWDAAHKPLNTSSKDNLYRRKFESIFGRQAVSTRALFLDSPAAADSGRGLKAVSSRLPLARSGHDRKRSDRGEAFCPVLLASLLLSIGWTVAVHPELFRSLSLMGAAPFSGRPELPTEALRFGFVGAYWFILQDLIRRYFRDDLRTSAYVSASVRIIVVVVLVATMALVPVGSMRQQAVLAFLVGVFPQLGVQILKTAVCKLGSRVTQSLDPRYPLSDLDGLSIWDEARLAEEGIEDLQGLVTANLVDVLLHTRVPVARLVDWLDQACLYLRLPEDGEGRRQLRALGIRTATDLERAWCQADRDRAVRLEIIEMLGGGQRGAATVGALLRTLSGDVNLAHVRVFRRHAWLGDEIPAAVIGVADDGPAAEAAA